MPTIESKEVIVVWCDSYLTAVCGILDKILAAQLVKKCSAFYGTLRFIHDGFVQ
jgi:hypothetical protein